MDRTPKCIRFDGWDYKRTMFDGHLTELDFFVWCNARKFFARVSHCISLTPHDNNFPVEEIRMNKRNLEILMFSIRLVSKCVLEYRHMAFVCRKSSNLWRRKTTKVRKQKFLTRVQNLISGEGGKGTIGTCSFLYLKILFPCLKMPWRFSNDF